MKKFMLVFFTVAFLALTAYAGVLTPQQRSALEAINVPVPEAMSDYFPFKTGTGVKFSLRKVEEGGQLLGHGEITIKLVNLFISQNGKASTGTYDMVKTYTDLKTSATVTDARTFKVTKNKSGVFSEESIMRPLSRYEFVYPLEEGRLFADNKERINKIITMNAKVGGYNNVMVIVAKAKNEISQLATQENRSYAPGVGLVKETFCFKYPAREKMVCEIAQIKE